MYLFKGEHALVLADRNGKETAVWRDRFLERLHYWKFYLGLLGRNKGDTDLQEKIRESDVLPLLGRMLRRHARQKTEASFLLAYVGHGSPIGWSASCAYFDLALTVEKNLATKRKLCIVNDTCYSSNCAGTVAILELHKRFRGSVSIIANKPSKGQAALDNLTRIVLGAWMVGMYPEARWDGEAANPLRPKRLRKAIVTRWGTPFDREFFIERPLPLQMAAVLQMPNLKYAANAA